MFWKKVMILDHFGDNWREHPSWPLSKTNGRHLEEIIDRCTPCHMDRQRGVQEPVLVQADSEPKTLLIYKITPDEF